MQPRSHISSTHTPIAFPATFTRLSARAALIMLSGAKALPKGAVLRLDQQLTPTTAAIPDANGNYIIALVEHAGKTPQRVGIQSPDGTNLFSDVACRDTDLELALQRVGTAQERARLLRVLLSAPAILPLEELSAQPWFSALLDSTLSQNRESGIYYLSDSICFWYAQATSPFSQPRFLAHTSTGWKSMPGTCNTAHLTSGEFLNIGFLHLPRKLSARKLILTCESNSGSVALNMLEAQQPAKNHLADFWPLLRSMQPKQAISFREGLEKTIEQLPEADPGVVPHLKGLLAQIYFLVREIVPESDAFKRSWPLLSISIKSVLCADATGCLLIFALEDPDAQLQKIEIVGWQGKTSTLTPRQLTRLHIQQNTSEQYYAAYVPLEPMYGSALALASVPFIWCRAIFSGGITLSLTPKIHQLPVPEWRKQIRYLFQGISITDALLDNVLLPAVLASQKQLAARARPRDVRHFGTIPNQPLASIIVPLYGNISWVTLQIAKLALDPYTLQNAELIFVCDDPSLAEALPPLLINYSELYGIGIKLVVNDENYGYAIACNHGARYARAEHLVFLNSDAFPAEEGWLAPMLERYKSIKNCGVLGTKLLFEDDSIQHAGIYFSTSEDGWLLGAHSHEGMPTDYPAANIPSSPLAVTGACFLISSARFREVGGIMTDSVIGDYEDIDLCLKLHEKGFTNHYMPEVTFYHLQRQSMLSNPETTHLFWRVNARRFHKRWSAYIKAALKPAIEGTGTKKTGAA